MASVASIHRERTVKKAFIILAHKNPAQLERLIDALNDGNSTFFIHIDKKSEASAFRQLAQRNTHIASVKSVSTNWADFSLVEATLNGMKAVLEHPFQFDFISLISGQHYPIKSNEYINDFLRETNCRTFLEFTEIPNYDRWKVRGGLYRLDKYFLGMRYHERITAKAMNFISSYTGFLKRSFPAHMKPYAGSQWWTMDNYTLRYVMNFVKNNKDFVDYHKRMFAPDELFFHNILLNADDDIVLSGIANNNLLYMNWPNLDHAHPEMLVAKDIDKIIGSDALFARKFDIDQDAFILDLVDESRGDKGIADML